MEGIGYEINDITIVKVIAKTTSRTCFKNQNKEKNNIIQTKKEARFGTRPDETNKNRQLCTLPAQIMLQRFIIAMK